MTTLEGHYRRLLGVYPVAHRRSYEQEMLGVLMAGSRPGQRLPAIGDAFDVLRAGLLARIGHSRRNLRTGAWREAAAVVGPLIAVLLLAVAGRRLSFGLRILWSQEDPMEAYGVRGLLLLDVGLRTVAWLAVVVAVLTGLRRTAAGLSVLAVLAELAALLWWLPADQDRPFQGLVWSPVLMLVCVAALFASIRSRSAAAILGRRGTLLIAAGFAVGAAAMLAQRSIYLPGLDSARELPWPVTVIVLALLIAGIHQAPGRVRRRAGVLLASALAVPVAHLVVRSLVPIGDDELVAQSLTIAAVLILVPPVSFLAGLLIVDRREEARG
jgi:hypothetical protein